jgi:hypothetical protein
MPIGGLAGLNERTTAATIGRLSAEPQPDSAANQNRPKAASGRDSADDARHGPTALGTHGSLSGRLPILARHETVLDPGATIESCACDPFFAAG